jgi:opacity protein-like surface antigen
MRYLQVLAVAGATAFSATASLAADIFAPPPLPVKESFGGWYLRGDIGMTNQTVDRLNNVLFPGTPNLVFHDLNFESGMLFGVGVGYQFNGWLRADITGEYRGETGFHGFDTWTDGGGFPRFNNYTAKKSEWLVLANAYVDLGTWWCITPYVGAGVGFADISILGYKDVNVPVQSVAYGQDNSQTNFAWALYAGFSYKVNPSLTLDLAYRYTDIGDIRTGRIATFDNVSTSGGFQIEDITSNDLLFSVRLALGSQPAPMPVAFK